MIPRKGVKSPKLHPSLAQVSTTITIEAADISTNLERYEYCMRNVMACKWRI